MEKSRSVPADKSPRVGPAMRPSAGWRHTILSGYDSPANFTSEGTCMNFYVAEGTTQRGPFNEQELSGMGLTPDTLVWREGMPQWQPAGQVAELRPLFARQAGPNPAPMAAVPIQHPAYATPSYATPYGAVPTPQDINGKKIAAGVCGILFGTFGIHKFILGLTGGAVTMLVLALVCLALGPFTCVSLLAIPVLHVIGIIEGIIYLCKPDAEFYQIYMVQQRQWF